VVVLTGTGDRFMTRVDRSWAGDMTPEKWDRIYYNGKRLLMKLLDIEVPVIAAINGPCHVHSEIPLLSDITLATTDTTFKDAPHFGAGTVPGDGVHLVWLALLGPNRARYFMLTGQTLSATEALSLGVINEVVERDDLMGRAMELAHQIAQKPDTTLRYTRVVLTQQLKRALLDDLGYGLALEGLNAYTSWMK